MSATAANTIDAATSPAYGIPPELELNRIARFLVWFAIISVLFLGQIAYNIGEFPLASDLLSYALIVLYLLLSGYAALSVPSLFIYISAVAIAALRVPFATSTTSWSSFLLLCVLYAPFMFRLVRRPGLGPVLDYVLKAYVLAATIIAVVAIVQLVAVNITKLDILTNIYFVLPKEVRGAGTYTFYREGGGGLVKANGFFLRESADLSLVTGLALLIEYRSQRRLYYLALLAAGLLSSFSGSGMIAVIAGLLLPKSWSRTPVFVAYACGFVLLIVVLSSLDDPFLNIWLGRFSEFGKPNTSAYARFVAPWEMVQNSFNSGLFATWLGKGAGSYFRDLATYRYTYEVADPTWAKVTYEYGVVGLLLFLALVIVRLYSSSMRIEACHFLVVSWIGFSFLLKPGYALLIWLLTLIPKAVIAPGAPRHEQPP
ncbi:hypothetical protein JQ615_17330 [Bradyrhizobium jicamae]|uniref:Polysaccharide polymerase n=1 Tax=Bradyrhizobium jicamae TaxID=280332 RepID=A0ABS5FK66_9BRAD|nr:hypothetical protein [Bradyrhizobium jicamae]MBR0797157.1 hypothetical protein [Bradyrhizobium jicamae]